MLDSETSQAGNPTQEYPLLLIHVRILYPISLSLITRFCLLHILDMLTTIIILLFCLNSIHASVYFCVCLKLRKVIRKTSQSFVHFTHNFPRELQVVMKLIFC